ncbi:MAG: helix-turn-helix transcriptional regulator [bacterium]
MVKKIKSTAEEFVESLSPKQKKEFDEEYKDLLLSEMILAAMEEDHISVKQLAKRAGVSPTIIQGIKSGIKKDFNMGNFFKILKGLGCTVLIKRKGHKFPLELPLQSNTQMIKK